MASKENEQDTSIDLASLDEMHRMIARKKANSFMEYVMRDEETGGIIKQAGIHRSWQNLCDNYKRLLIWSHVESGKALAIDTPIPTPNGWVEMGDLSKGDYVFSSSGAPAEITFATEFQYDHSLYRITFEDDSELIADKNHKWVVYGQEAPREDGTCCCGCGHIVSPGGLYIRGHHHKRIISNMPKRVVTTEYMYKYGRYKNEMSEMAINPYMEFKLPLPGPVEYPQKPLPISPYIVGLLLTNAKVGTRGLILAKRYYDIYEFCKQIVPSTIFEQAGDKYKVIIGGDSFKQGIEQLQLSKTSGIPSNYLLASVAQRTQLLQGILDMSGNINQQGSVTISTFRENYARDLHELICSLGFKVHLSTYSSGQMYGQSIATNYILRFVAYRPVFKLKWKLSRQRLGNISFRVQYKSIRNIELLPNSSPVRCIAVDSPDNTFLAGKSYTVTHNTNQISVGRTLFELGKNRSLRVAIVSNTQEQAKKIVGTIGRYIERSDELKLVFPELKRGDIWTQTSISVQRDTVIRDPSVQAFGIHGAVLGARIDLIIMDDILDFENCRTPALRQELWDWIHATLMGRLTKNARIWIVGTAFHPDDALHRFSRKGTFHAVRYPIVDPKTDEPRWPERWSKERIDERRNEMSHAPSEWARQFLCIARDDTSAQFKKDWINAAVARGERLDMPYALERIPPGCSVYTGVDLAVQKHNAAGDTVLFTILVHPNKDREVISVEAGKWNAPVIIDKIIDVHDRYMSTFIVENNAAQDYLIQFTREKSDVPILPFTTGRNKAHPEFGVGSIADEFRNGKWIIPSRSGVDKEVQEWISEMLYYEPTSHTGDRLMASWFAREGLRMKTTKAKVSFMHLDLTSR